MSDAKVLSLCAEKFISPLTSDVTERKKRRKLLLHLDSQPFPERTTVSLTLRHGFSRQIALEQYSLILDRVKLRPYDASFDWQSVRIQRSDKTGVIGLEDRCYGRRLWWSKNETEVTGVRDS